MAAVTEADTHTATVMSATQLLKTELLLNVCGYHIHQDPAPILFIQPTQTGAKRFAKNRFEKTREVTPVLRDRIANVRVRDSNNTTTHKEYPGGTLDFVGAKTPADLAEMPKRITLADEIDKYERSAGEEGDPLALGEERASTYWNKKHVRACSPTVKGESRIEEEYEKSDQRRCFVTCPHCKAEQTLKWSMVHWSKTATGEHLPETVQIHCEHCGSGWSERERVQALRGLAKKSDYGWRQTKKFTCCGVEQTPTKWDHRGRRVCGECGELAPYDGHAGFHASKLLSTRHRLPDVVREHLGAKTIEARRKFTNTALAETFEEKGREADTEGLKAHVETYGPYDLPAGVHYATAGVDVQHDRLEVEIIGWGLHDENWGVVYSVLWGDPAQGGVWEDLEELLNDRYWTEDGRLVRVRATCIDANDSETAAYVFQYCRPRIKRRVFPIKGVPGVRIVFPERPTLNKHRQKFWSVGVDTAKGWWYGRFALEEEGPGYCHIPAEYDEEWFEQVTSEQVMTRFKEGKAYKVWKLPAGKRNEALDCRVYAYAARMSLTPRLRRPSKVHSEKVVEADQEPVADEQPERVMSAVIAEKKKPAKPARRRRRSGFVKKVLTDDKPVDRHAGRRTDPAGCGRHLDLEAFRPGFGLPGG